MATVTQRWSGRVYTDDASDQQYQQIYDVVGTTDIVAARAAVTVLKDDRYGTTAAKCKTVTMASVGNGHFTATATYSIPPNGSWATSGTGDNDASVLSRPTVVEWSNADEDRPCDRDTKGCAIVNSNGDPFDPGTTRPLKIKVLKLTKWFSNYDLALATSYEQKVNSAAVLLRQPSSGSISFDVQFCRCVSCLPAAAYNINALFIPVTAVLEFIISNDNDTGGLATTKPFQARFLNQGSTGWYQDGSAKKTGKFVTSRGDDLPGPVRIKQDGTPYDTSLMIRAYDKLFTPVATGYTSSSSTATYTANADQTATFVEYTRYLATDLRPLLTTFGIAAAS